MKYLFGQYQHILGLEEKLRDFDIAHAGGSIITTPIKQCKLKS